MRLFYGELVWYHDCLVHKKIKLVNPTSNFKPQTFCRNLTTESQRAQSFTKKTTNSLCNLCARCGSVVNNAKSVWKNLELQTSNSNYFAAILLFR